MAYVAETYDGGRIAATDLQRIEDNFAYLRVSFRSGSAPSDPGGLLSGLEGVIWWDSTKKNFKGRSDSAWRALLSASTAFKLWVYLNAADDGWVVDSSVADMVLALKGGATYTTGADTAGSWQVSGLTRAEHSHTDGTYKANHSHGMTRIQSYLGGWPDTIQDCPVSTDPTNADITGASGPQSNATINSNETWRPEAAVGTLQYPNV
jgi:hypothetical protein